MQEYKDYMIRAVAADAQIRAFAITSRDLTETARKAHNTSPIATAALGRAMSGALMMAEMLKGPRDLLTIQIDGDGPMQGLVVTADNQGRVKGYVKKTDVILPPNEQGHLNVGGAIGRGTLTVIRDMNLKDPYIGQIPLVTGEIAEDLTAYYAQSEQIPSSVGLGVLMNKDNLSPTFWMRTAGRSTFWTLSWKGLISRSLREKTSVFTATAAGNALSAG